MKYILLIILCFSFFMKSFSQEYHLSVISEKDGFKSVVLVDSHDNLDTIAQFAYDIKLLDYKILSRNKICFIIEAPLHIQYEKFIKNDSEKWLRSDTSGILGSNTKIRPVPLRHDLEKKTRSFKIIDEDLVEVKDSSNKYIKNCKEFSVERKKWIEDCRKSKKY